MPRTKIPGRVSDIVRIQSVDRCCVCERRGQQIHHLNENNSDHDLDNLALLCLGCHDRATRGPGLGHGLSARTIRSFRGRWYGLVAERAERFARRPKLDKFRSKKHVDDLHHVLLAHEVRKLRWAIARESSNKRNWPAIAVHVGSLWEYAREGSPMVQEEVLEAVDGAVSLTRFGMHYETAENIRGVLTELIPLPRRRRPGVPRSAREDEKRLERILYILWNLAYDAILYNENLAIAEAALDPLKWIYRYAELNKARRLQSKAAGKFKDLKETAQRSQWKEAEQLVDHELANASKVGTGWELSPPENVAELIRSHRAFPPGRRIDRQNEK